MVFQSKDFYGDVIENKDLNEVREVYNSNDHFLMNHMDRNKVTSEWILQEIESVRDVGFQSCKIVEISTGRIIGIVDFKVDDETYLSLLMIHNDFQGKGFGKLVFQAFEQYTKSLKSKCIRIDVVTNYNKSVLNFWFNNGFIKFKDVELNWTGKILSAVTMKKFM